jgi:hypothetical protein
MDGGLTTAPSSRAFPCQGGTISVHQGDVATVFQHLATRFHNEVEPLVWPGNWGYAERDIRGSTEISNHASGTAIDLNAPKHPLGTDPLQNYTTGQIAAIHNIVAFYEGIIRWGGDYVGRKDGMHFEINDGITEAQVARIAAKITKGVHRLLPRHRPRLRSLHRHRRRRGKACQIWLSARPSPTLSRCSIS